MGYKRKLYTVKWPEDHELHGLEVTTKGLSVGKMFELAGLVQSLSAKSAETQADAADRLFAGFASRLVHWNLEEDDGTPVPATQEGVSDQDFNFMLDLVTEWLGAVASVDSPLKEGSASGENALEASLPMEPLSPSLSS